MELRILVKSLFCQLGSLLMPSSLSLLVNSGKFLLLLSLTVCDFFYFLQYTEAAVFSGVLQDIMFSMDLRWPDREMEQLLVNIFIYESEIHPIY